VGGGGGWSWGELLGGAVKYRNTITLPPPPPPPPPPNPPPPPHLRGQTFGQALKPLAPRPPCRFVDCVGGTKPRPPRLLQSWLPAPPHHLLPHPHLRRGPTENATDTLPRNRPANPQCAPSRLARNSLSLPSPPAPTPPPHVRLPWPPTTAPPPPRAPPPPPPQRRPATPPMPGCGSFTYYRSRGHRPPEPPTTLPVTYLFGGCCQFTRVGFFVMLDTTDGHPPPLSRTQIPSDSDHLPRHNSAVRDPFAHRFLLSPSQATPLDATTCAQTTRPPLFRLVCPPLLHTRTDKGGERL